MYKKVFKSLKKSQEDKINEHLGKLKIGYEYDRGDIDTKTPEGKEKVKGKLTTKNLNSSLYSVPSEKNVKGIPKKTGHQAGTINVFGAHYPVVKIMNDNTLLLHTSDYGDSEQGMQSKTRQLVDKIQKEVPEHFPDMKIVKINHPDYTHSSRIMRENNHEKVSQYLQDASQNHPDEEYRQHAAESHLHLNPVKKGFNTKPIHQKRIENEGWDGKKNIENRTDRIHQYLQKIGLSADLGDNDENTRAMGAREPNALGVNPKGDPTDQQLIHEAGHAVLTPENAKLEDYQEMIGSPGLDAKVKASQQRETMQDHHGGGMPEQTAQHAEAAIARRSGVNPFRVPKRSARSDTAEEGARRHAKKQINMLDEGIHRFNPQTGRKEIQGTVNAHINAKSKGFTAEAEKISGKLKEKYKEKNKLKEQNPDAHDFLFGKSEDASRQGQEGLKPQATQQKDPVIELNHDHGKEVADAYHSMKHDPSHPEVKEAYGALVGETKKQFEDISNSGIKISRIKHGQENPYKNSKELHHDIKNNNHMWFFPTKDGFGSDAEKDFSDHPMLQGTGVHHDGEELLANDMFRIVHDINGHHHGGETGFGPKGEHQAYNAHKKMYSPLANKALATETLGQNSWVNFGPHGEHNRSKPHETKYADQKAGLMPDHIVNGNWHTKETK